MGWENKCFRSQENLLAVIKEKSRSKETLSWSVRVRELGKTTESYHKKQEVISTKDPLASCSLLSLPPSSGKTNSRHAGFETKIWNSHCFVLRANAGNTGGTSVTLPVFASDSNTRENSHKEVRNFLFWVEEFHVSLSQHPFWVITRLLFSLGIKIAHPKPPAALH